MRRIAVTDREAAEIDDGLHKDPEKRQMERNGRLAALCVRFLDRGDAGMFIRPIGWNYMWR